MRVSIQEFKSHLAQYIISAQSGQTIELTSHRKVVARLTGIPQTGNEGWTRLLAKGSTRWQGGKPAGADIRLQEHCGTVSNLVLDDRG